MGLYERLMHLETQKLAVHQFMAALGEQERGNMSVAEIATAFTLSAAEQTELATLTAKIVLPLESITFGGFLTLTNVGTAYDGTTASLGLGFARVQCAGLTGFEFTVGMNRNGAAGTISWQLWDDTNTVELARIDDLAGAGAKYVSVTWTFNPPLAAGIRRARVRAKSTTAADDPIYLGANVVIRRVARLTSVELHEVLCLAEQRTPPYDTVAALKSRLGV